jgi:uncharacterized phage protein (TIGR01671 family)
MREYKFRGYIKQYLGMKGYFVYGLLARYNNELATIISGEKIYVVESKTVGQYTGLPDKNNVEIYEGDRVKLIDSQNRELICNVEYIVGSFWYVIQHNQLTIGMWEYYNFGNKTVEVIGNIHDKEKDND